MTGPVRHWPCITVHPHFSVSSTQPQRALDDPFSQGLCLNLALTPHPPPCRRPYLSARSSCASSQLRIHPTNTMLAYATTQSRAPGPKDKASHTNSLRRRIRLKTPRSAKSLPPPTRSPSHPTPRLLSNRRHPSVKFSRLRLRLAPKPSINRRPCLQAAKRSLPAAIRCRRNTPQLFFNLQLHKASKWHSPRRLSPSPVFTCNVGHPAPKLRRRRCFRQASRLFNLCARCPCSPASEFPPRVPALP
jgi:hypothetical protein